MEHKDITYEIGYMYDCKEGIIDLDARLGKGLDIIIGVDRIAHEEDGTPTPEYRMELPELVHLHQTLGRLIERIRSPGTPDKEGWYHGSEYIGYDSDLFMSLKDMYKDKWADELANFMEGEGLSLQTMLSLTMEGNKGKAIHMMEETLWDGIKYHREEEMEFRFNGVEYIWIEGE